MAHTDTKQAQQDTIVTMRKWQQIENTAIASTGQIIEHTTNPLIRLVAEIIQHDSLMHRRVQQFITDSMELRAVSLSPNELTEVWDLIERHLEIEKRTIEMSERSISSLRSQQGMVVQNYLVDYLLEDELKHTHLLSRLDDIKAGTYRSV